MRQEKSCGAIVFRQSNGTYEFLLVTHIEANSGHTEFPKGHMDGNESEQETTIREVLEETGTDIELIEGFREEYSYAIGEIQKTVTMFLGKSTKEGGKMCDPNIISCEWAEYSQALEKLTYDTAKDLLKKATGFLKL